MKGTERVHDDDDDDDRIRGGTERGINDLISTVYCMFAFLMDTSSSIARIVGLPPNTY